MKKREALYLKRLGDKKRVMKTFCSFLYLMLSNNSSRMRGKVYRKEQNLASHKKSFMKKVQKEICCMIVADKNVYTKE